VAGDSERTPVLVKDLSVKEKRREAGNRRRQQGKTTRPRVVAETVKSVRRSLENAERWGEAHTQKTCPRERGVNIKKAGHPCLRKGKRRTTKRIGERDGEKDPHLEW